MGNKFEHRVGTHRHEKKFRAKNCDALPAHRSRVSAQAATSQLTIFGPKVRFFSAPLEPPKAVGGRRRRASKKLRACQVFIF
jgi:hypothetical protein